MSFASYRARSKNFEPVDYHKRLYGKPSGLSAATREADELGITYGKLQFLKATNTLQDFKRRKGII